MIITRTPLRISFVGGGTDIASFYERERGAVVSTTINKYVYVILHRFFDKRIQLKYSETEIVNSVNEINHPVFREALKLTSVEDSIEISIVQDLPKEGGSGLGGSTAFSVGLINALNILTGKYLKKEELANWATFLEIEKLGNPIGKQDQFASSYGGLNYITFNSDEVSVKPIDLKEESLSFLEENLMMFYTGITRNANDILEHMNLESNKTQVFNSQVRMRDLADKLYIDLLNNELSNFGKLMHENWILKDTLSSKISNPTINEIYDLAINSGAEGGKILGAGGGGFFLFYCHPRNQEKLRNRLNLQEYNFKFEDKGTQLVMKED